MVMLTLDPPAAPALADTPAETSEAAGLGSSSPAAIPAAVAVSGGSAPTETGSSAACCPEVAPVVAPLPASGAGGRWAARPELAPRSPAWLPPTALTPSAAPAGSLATAPASASSTPMKAAVRGAPIARLSRFGRRARAPAGSGFAAVRRRGRSGTAAIAGPAGAAFVWSATHEGAIPDTTPQGGRCRRALFDVKVEVLRPREIVS